MNKKYKYYYVLQGNYGYGWDDLIFYDKNSLGYKEAINDIRDYRKNEVGAVFRIISRRVLMCEV